MGAARRYRRAGWLGQTTVCDAVKAMRDRYYGVVTNDIYIARTR